MAWETEYIGDKEKEEKNYDYWNPEEGDTLQGKVEKVEEGFYKKKTLYVETDDGITYRTSEAGGLHWQIEKLKIVKGDVIHLEYRGLKEINKTDENGDPITAHDYKLMKWVEE